jgi:hypothetical protein
MKTRFIGVLLFTGMFIADSRAQQALPSEPSASSATSLDSRSSFDVIERGEYYKVVRGVRVVTNASGQVVLRTNRYTILQNGMNFTNANGEWVESHPVVQTFSGGIVCTGASYRVILNANLNTAQAVDLETRDRRRVISRPIGLGLYDPETGGAYFWLG